MGDRLEALADDAEESLTNVRERVADVDDIDALAADLEGDDLDDLRGDVDVLIELVDEVEDLLDSIDLTELPGAVDASELLEAIEVGEIPDALSDGDADDVVELRGLLKAIDLAELWDAADVRELWQAKRDVDEATDELTEGSEDRSVVSKAADAVTDDDGDDDELIEGDLVDDDAGSFDVGDGDSFGLDAEDTQAYQTMIQKQAMDGLEEFREALLYTHEKFQTLYEHNRETMRRQDTSPNSRNPTAVSTMTTDRADLGSTARSSTVPKQVRHSSAPGHDRIYGRRFERELEKRRDQRGEDDG